MAAKSQLEATLSGSLDDFTQELDRPYSTEAKRLELVNRHLYTRVREVYTTMISLIDKRVRQVAGEDFQSARFYDPAFAMLKNAVDSVTERFSQEGPNYKANLRFEITFDDDEFWFKIEDNGTGVSSDIKPLLGKKGVHSNKRGDSRYCGGHGIDLKCQGDFIHKMNGVFYHKDRPDEQGAIFCYILALRLWPDS